MLLAAWALAGCGHPVPMPSARVLAFGEQHDQPDQQRQVADAVIRLAAAGRLDAVVLEMAGRGTGTAGLPRDADEAAVRQALGWTDRAWPWAPYAPVVMAAVRAGVPVHGGNLPRPSMKAAMADATLDAVVSPEVAGLLADAIRAGHCDALPEAMAPGMLRIQVARDRDLADVVHAQWARGQGTVLLLAGAQHASRDRGVPWHLVHRHGVPPHEIRVVMFNGAVGGLVADERRPAELAARPDPCEALRSRGR